MEGRKLYKSFNIENYLNVEELPREIVVSSATLTVETSEENLQKWIVAQGETFLRATFILSVNFNDSTGCILFFRCYSVALVTIVSDINLHDNFY